MATTLSHLIVKLDADIAGLEKGTTAAERAVVNMGRKMQSVGKTMSAAVTLPLAAIGVASTKMAADAEENANKFAVVMGDSADRVNARLKELHKTIPLTTSQMQGLTAGVQDLLVPMGVVRSEAADMSATMVELAGDLGSFNNVKPDEVLEAMKSALAGSSEPMRRFGVDTRVARLEALALEAGLIQMGEKMDSAATAQAVLLAIQQDSTDAIGDAARTVDSASNSFKFFARDAKELGITIGNILIPIVTPMIQRLGDAVRMFDNLSPAAQKVVVAIAAFAAAAGPVLIILGTLATLAPAIGAAFTVMMGPVGLAIVAFAALVAGGVALIDNWGVISYEVTRMVDAIRDALVGRFNAIVESVRGKVQAVGDFFGGLYDRVVGNSYVPDLIDGIAAQFGRLDEVMVRPAMEAAGKVDAAFSDVAAPDTTGAKFSQVVQAGASGPIAQMGQAFASFGPMGALLPIINAAMEELAPVVEALLEPFKIIGRLIGQVIAPVLQLLAPALQLVATAFSYVIEAIGWFIEALGKFIDSIVPDWISKAGKGLAEFGQQMQENARAARKSTEATEDAAEAANRLAAGMVNAVRGFKTAAYAHGATAVPATSTTTTTAAAPVNVGGVTIHTSGDGKETYRNWYDEMDRKTRGMGGPARAFFRSMPAPV